jgi:hypothetical protein
LISLREKIFLTWNHTFVSKNILIQVPTPPQEETLSDLDDDLEVQNMLAVSNDEVEFKTLLWTDANKDWIEAQKGIFCEC